MYHTGQSFSFISPDDLSVEVNSDGFSHPPNPFTSPNDFDLTSLFGSDMLLEAVDVSGSCDQTDVLNSIDLPTDFCELDKYFSYQPEPSVVFDSEPNQLALNDLPIYPRETTKKSKSHKKPIPLSSSVAIGAPQRAANLAGKIEIVYELEEKYRPRYKTDYFALSGTKRKPRYVTDRHGGHFITLRVAPGVRGKIRVDWLTIPDANGERYVMPYRFQTNNDSNDDEDCNPTYEEIRADPATSLLKLYLVLIKAKQDALKSLQPLQPFRPLRDLLGMNDYQPLDKTLKMSPKKLIQKYQLNKSQLAFTLCTPSADGHRYIAEWDTTVYSTVLEEEAMDSSSTSKTISCPNCSTEISIGDDSPVTQETGAAKRKGLPIVKEKSKAIKKQKSVTDCTILFD